MVLDTAKFRALPRKSYPLKNFIEQTLFSDYRKWFKNLGTITQELQQAELPNLNSSIGKRSRDAEFSQRVNKCSSKPNGTDSDDSDIEKSLDIQSLKESAKRQ